MTDNADLLREEGGRLVRRLPTYAKLALAVGREPSLPAARRAALIGAGSYVLSPIGLVPGFVPVLGQLDDLWVLLAALRAGLEHLPSQRRDAVLAEAELTMNDLAKDLDAIRDLAAWSIRQGGSAARSLGRAGLRLGRQAAARLRNAADR